MTTSRLWHNARVPYRIRDFAGAAAPILDLIAEYYQDDPDVDLEAIAAARAKLVSMLERAASLDVVQRIGVSFASPLARFRTA